MSLLLESIKYHEGRLHNLKYHEARMQHAYLKIFGKEKEFNLNELIQVPKVLKNELYKCRIVYDTEIRSVEFSRYRRKRISSIKLVTDETISYPHKFEMRNCINKHTKNLAKGEEVIFVKKGLLRDASFSNIALFNGKEWHTPCYPLLKGTRRAELLEKGLIKSKKIRPADLSHYERISFISAMNDLDELSLKLKNKLHKKTTIFKIQ